MGGSDLKAFKGNSNSQVLAVCEVDAERLGAAREPAGIDPGSCCKDFRELLARSDLAQWGLGMDNSGPVEIVGQGEFPRSGLFTTAAKSPMDPVARRLRTSTADYA